MAKYRASDGKPEESSRTKAAGQEVGNVSRTATQAAGQVAQTTKEQATEVSTEVRRQARDLLGEARIQAQDQTTKQRDRAASGLRTLGDELDQMAERGGQSGVATEMVRRLSDRTRDVATFIEQREPGDLLEDVRSFARRRSGAFLAGAVLAGVVVGRLTRAAVAPSGDHQQPWEAETGTAGRLPYQTDQHGLPTSGDPASQFGTPGGPAYSTTAGSVYAEPAHGEPGYTGSGSGRPEHAEQGTARYADARYDVGQYGEAQYGAGRHGESGRSGSGPGQQESARPGRTP